MPGRASSGVQGLQLSLAGVDAKLHDCPALAGVLLWLLVLKRCRCYSSAYLLRVASSNPSKIVYPLYIPRTIQSLE
eukprot:scaffold369803_cov36-Prasinocladus_malaysianus.AAC.1